MKLNWKAGFAVLLGLISARVIFYLAHYNSSDDFSSFRRLVIDFGVPMATTLIWLWIIETILKSRSK
jgi:hypothetical protein